MGRKDTLFLTRFPWISASPIAVPRECASRCRLSFQGRDRASRRGSKIPSRDRSSSAILVRFRRPGNRVRRWLHERTRMVLPHRRARPPRALRPRRPARRPRRLRRPGRLPGSRIPEPLRLPPPRDRPLPRVGLLPAGGGPAGPALSRGRGAHPGGTLVHHHRERARQGDDRGEPGRGAAQVLRVLPPGGEAAGGGDPAGGGGACHRPTGWTGLDPSRKGGQRFRGSAARPRWRIAGSSAGPTISKPRTRPTGTRSWTTSPRGARSRESLPPATPAVGEA